MDLIIKEDLTISGGSSIPQDTVVECSEGPLAKYLT